MPKEVGEKKEIKTIEITLKVKDKATAESLKFYDDKKWTEAKKEIKFTKRTSPKDKSWRLVHDGKKVLMLFESDGETHTAYELFCGDLEDCRKEIEKLKLGEK